MFAAVEMTNEALVVIGSAYGILWAAFQIQYRERVNDLKEQNKFLRAALARALSLKPHPPAGDASHVQDDDTGTHSGPAV